MKFVVKNTGENVVSLARRIGYYLQAPTPNKVLVWGQGESFVRPLEKSGYPRFHLYIKKDNEELIFNLHLDQKRPVYKNAPAHAGEYDGKVVETEAQRIKQILK